MCSFSKIDAPTDAAGETVVDREHHGSTNGLNIPMAIGKIRKSTFSRVIDVIVHPWVTEQSGRDQGFRFQVVELVLTWVEKEVKAKLSRKYTVNSKKYVAHDCKLPGIPIFFELEDPNNPATEEEPGAGVVSPEDILKSMSVPPSQDEETTTLKLPSELSTGNDTKPLITEVSKEKKKKPKPAVKAGFLHSKKAKEMTLYPNGSQEGAPKTFMQRAKIVDLNKMSPEEARAAMEEHGKGTKARPAPAAPLRSKAPNAVEGIMKDMNFGEETDEFDRIAGAADRDFGASNVMNGSAFDNSGGEDFDMFSKLAQSFMPELSTIAPRQSSRPKCSSPSSSPVLLVPEYTLKEVHRGGKAFFEARISLKGLSKLPVDTELDVSKTRLKFNGGGYKLEIDFPQDVLATNVTAKFKKKRGVMLVTAEML